MRQVVKYRVRKLDGSWTEQFEYFARDEGAMEEVNAEVETGNVAIDDIEFFPEKEELISWLTRTLDFIEKGFVSTKETREILLDKFDQYVAGLDL